MTTPRLYYHFCFAMSRRRLVYIVSDVKKSLAFEWLVDNLNGEYDLSFLLVGESPGELGEYIKGRNVPCYIVADHKYKGYLPKFIAVARLLSRIRPDIIHTHLWRANLLGLTSGWVLRIPKRILTRHHATVHYDQYPSGRKWDRLCNNMATDIIAISKNIKEILLARDKAQPNKVHVVNHGFDLNFFSIVSKDRVAKLHLKHNIPSNATPIVGVIARYTEWKGIQFVIAAFHSVVKKYPNAHLVLANAHGDYTPVIQELLSYLPKKSYTEIMYEGDLAALYRLFDVYVHVPVNASSEAFGQTYVEALASGIPAVFTLSGIATEFIKHRVNALVVDYCNPTQIEQAIIEILGNQQLRETLVTNGKSSVAEFSLEKMVSKLKSIYG